MKKPFPRLADILAHARSQIRIVVTFDLDFGDLLAAVTPRVLDVAERFAGELEAGALIVVEDARIRLRRLPLR